MRMEWYQRKLAVFLSVILILEPVVQVLPAMAYGKTVMEIEEFEELDESVMVQTVPYGTAYEDLDLPDYLSAQVFEVTAEDEEEDEEVASGSDATSSDASSSAATPANASSSDATVSDASGGEDGYRMIPVTWELSSGPGGLSDYDGETAGTYVFDAVLAAGGYRVGDAILPFIEVEVLEAEPLPVTALLTTNGDLIDISNATVVIDGTYTYNGSAQVPSKDNIKVILNGEEINLTNCSIQSSNNVNAGNTAMVSVTAENDDTYTGTAFGSFEIGRAGLTVEGITFYDREYDGTDIVTVKDEGELQGVIGNDDVSMDVTGLTCTVNSANAGTYTSVTLSGLSLTGADANNYTVPEQTVNENVTISPKELTVESISFNNREYDGTNIVTVEDEGELSGVIGNDDVSMDATDLTCTVDSANAGTYTSVTLSGLSLTGADANNYTVPEQTVNENVTISPKELTVEGISFYDREYNGTNIVTVNYEGWLQGVIGNDDVNMDVTDLTCTVDSANAGIYTSVTLSGLSLTGADADNYKVPEQTVNENVTISPISASNLNISLSWDSYEYDGTAKEPSVADVSFAGATVPESEYTVSVSYENNVNAGSATATATFTGNCSGSVTEDFTIHPKELTVTDATVSDREYDGTNVVEVSEVTLDGVIGTDDVSVDVSGISGELDNADAGTYSSVQLAGLWSLDGNDASNYTVTKPTSAVSTTVTISPKTVSGLTVELSQDSYEYDGTAREPRVTVTDGTTEISSSEYTVSYTNNVEAGTATVTITDVAGGNYTVSESTTTFAITALSLDDAVVTVAGSYTYDGTEQTPLASDITVSLNGNTVAASNYTVSVSDNTKAGTATVTVTGSGSCSGSATGSFTIAAKAVNSPIITLSQDTYGYDGTAKEPRVTVTDGTIEIPSGEYTVSYANNVEAGTATVTITNVAGGNYTVSESSMTFAITALSLDDAVVTVAGSYTYDGTEQTPLASDITVSLNGNTISSANYTISVSNNTSAGTATVTVTGTGSYSGRATGSFTIEAKTVSEPTITLSQNTYEYDGTEKKPDVTVTDGTTEISSSEYTVSYANNVEAGTATVTITDVAGGNYTVSGTADFTIQAKATEEETDSDERESSVQFSDNGRWMSGARGWWYSDHNGDYPKGEWRQLSWLGKTNWYYFDAEGWMVTGWLDWNGKRYHLHTISDGTLGYMYTGWEQIDGVWYYFDESGALLINGMTPDGHRTDENGARVE